MHYFQGSREHRPPSIVKYRFLDNRAPVFYVKLSGYDLLGAKRYHSSKGHNFQNILHTLEHPGSCMGKYSLVPDKELYPIKNHLYKFSHIILPLKKANFLCF